ncbi:MAG: hypothetical protein HPY76_02185 [Anaerolineae bacterium]|jgi:hypothetical protein|nr:hypothetical protein [Anaerolineae bacterium]
MKLSMFILADWLEKYKPTISITGGLPVLSGARICSDCSFDGDDSVLLIGRAADLFPEKYQGEQVICKNKEDWILIDSINVNEVLNDVLKAIEFYNDWEFNLKEAAFSNESFQMLIDISYPIFKNPIFMVDWFGKVLGLTTQSEAKMDGTVWNYMRTNGYLPAYVYDVVKMSSKQFRDIENNKDVFYLEIPDFDYQCFHCTVFVENKPYLNFEISENETRLTESTRQLAEILRQAVVIKLRFSDTSAFNPSAQTLLSEILYGKPYLQEALNQVLFKLGWVHTKSWYLTTFLNPFSGGMSGMVLLQQLGRELPKGYCFEWESQIIMLMDCKDWEEFLPVFTIFLQDTSFSAGVSLPFSDFKDIPIALKQAKAALFYSKRDSGLSMIVDHALDYILNEFSQNFKSEGLIHPALETLENYDLENNSELSKTLYVYLKNERSMNVTAKALFIHRNTLRYRLEQIGQLINVDLDDSDIRMYLLLSYPMRCRK